MTGYKGHPKVSQIKRVVFTDGQYLHTIILLTVADENNIQDLTHPYRYNASTLDEFEVVWPRKMGHGTQIDEALEPLSDFPNWLTDQPSYTRKFAKV